MVDRALTGTRVRNRRLDRGLRQAAVAKAVGISGSYLNLIEHNRRRIGGKLLLNIAQVLGVEPSMLTQGAEAALIATLREAAADAGAVAAEVDRADEFAGRFPGWAEVLAGEHRRIASLERTVETLSDRLTHDPHLAASLHEVLSTAAAIRSTASILAETGGLEQEWRDRFHKNLNEDSLRLAESSKALVGYLDESGNAEDRRGAPQEDVEAFIARQGHYFAALEEGHVVSDDMLETVPELTSNAARNIARDVLVRYAEDAEAMPLPEFRGALEQHGPDPVRLSGLFGTSLSSVFRRFAAMPDGVLPGEVGLVVCDASGSIIYRKQIEGFAMPRFGESCPLWPIYTALSRPMVPLRRRVSQLGRSSLLFDCFAVAEPVTAPEFDTDPLFHSTMLILPVPTGTEEGAGVQPVGGSCRVCPRDGCRARREPSILSEGF